jgi:hypothetical protein
MATIIDFQPGPGAPPFAFNPTLDGQVYSASVTWNIFGQRWYLTLQDLGGNLIFHRALTGTRTGLQIQTLAWANGRVSGTTEVPQDLRIGDTFRLTIAGCLPDAYNVADAMVFITGPTTFQYQLAANPGQATLLGTISAMLDLAKPFFESSLIYRLPNNQFEISP